MDHSVEASVKNRITEHGPGWCFTPMHFSEDIDLSIEKDFFDFGTPHDPENAPSKKKQNVIIDNLSKACSTYVQTQMLAGLKIENIN